MARLPPAPGRGSTITGWPKLRAHSFGDGAREYVGLPARGEGKKQAHRLLGVRLGEQNGRKQRQRKRGESLHRFSPFAQSTRRSASSSISLG